LDNVNFGPLRRASLLWIAMLALCAVCFGQAAASPSPEQVTVQGTVENAAHTPVADATVSLQGANPASMRNAMTDSGGRFTFQVAKGGSFTLRAEKAGLHSRAMEIVASQGVAVTLVLEGGTAAADAMEFADKPNFTVAGVVDWTAVGGHGSDAILRTTEGLARDTVALKARQGEPNGTGSTAADLHRVAAERAEKAGDALTAVHEFEQAARLDASEENYFAWGSELLLHRAVWQAQEIFGKALGAYPKSARIHTGLGTALFAEAKYDEAARRLCEAADLNPEDAAPYLFLGKIGIVAPTPLPCVEEKLAQYARLQPGNALANYFYAMAILKRQEQAPDPALKLQAEALFSRAVADDAKCGDAYLQLGILSYAKRDVAKAVDYYTKAIEANGQLGEAHYRLGVAYDRLGESEKAKQEFQIHTEIERQQAEAVERQRREVKQFQVVMQGQPGATQTN